MKTTIALIAGLGGFPGSPLSAYRDDITALADEFGAAPTAFAWDEIQNGDELWAYRDCDQTLVIAHSFGVCRAMVDSYRLMAAGLSLQKYIVLAIDGVRFTKETNPATLESDSQAQISRQPIIFPANVSEVHSVRRKMSLVDSMLDDLHVPEAINSPVSGGLVFTDEEVDVTAQGFPHNAIVGQVQPRIMGAVRGYLEAA